MGEQESTLPAICQPSTRFARGIEGSFVSPNVYSVDVGVAFTLSNPSARAIEGTLEFVGYPSDATADAAHGEVTVTLGTSGVDRLEELRIEPGTYTVIDLVAEAGKFVPGELSVVWSVAGREAQTSV